MCFPVIQRLIDWFKKFSVPRIILALFFILLVICVVWLYPRTSCTISGGDWEPIGLAQRPACIYTYPDAGKACQSSEECIGACVIYDLPAQGQPMPSAGVCKATNDPFGCYALIEHPEIYACSD